MVRFVVGLLMLGTVLPLWAADKSAQPGPDPALVKQALALNEVTGDAAVQGKLRALEADPSNSKKLIAAAATLARDQKDSPFTYNAAMILAQTARAVKDRKNGELFFRICVNQARKLGSAHKLKDAYSGLLALVLEKGDAQEAGAVCREILELPMRQDQEQLAELKLQVLQLAIESLVQQGKTPEEKTKNTEKALAMADQLVKIRPHDWQVLGIRAAAYRHAGRKTEAAAGFAEMMKQIAARHPIKDQQRIWFDDGARYLVQQGKGDEAIRIAQQLAQGSGENWRGLEPLAWTLREAGRDEEAAKAYERVLAAVQADNTADADERNNTVEFFRYMLSGVYVEANQIDKAAECLRELLKAHPDSPTFNNDLGYIWADHDMNLDESEKMIQKALDLDRKRRHALPSLKPEDDRDNASYLDSLGWVLYKKKDYQGAKKYLLEAVKDKVEGQHIDIYDHLGEVYKALGDRAEAVASWRKGIGAAGPGKRDQQRKAEVEKKLKAAQESEARKR